MRATDEDIRALEQLAAEIERRDVESRDLLAVELERQAVEARELRAVEMELSRAVSIVVRCAGLPSSSIIVGLLSRKETALVTPHPARLTSRSPSGILSSSGCSGTVLLE